MTTTNSTDPDFESPPQATGCTSYIMALIALLAAAFIGAAVVSGCYDGDPELDEGAVGDEELDAAPPNDDLDAQIATEDAYYVSHGQRPLSQWERCMYRAKRENKKGVEVCGTPPTPQQ